MPAKVCSGSGKFSGVRNKTFVCGDCGRSVRINKDGRYSKHTRPVRRK